MSDNISKKKKVAVIGGGASGLIASYFSSLSENEVTLFEKNEKLGKKIYITGKGRCNVCNDCSVQDFLNNVVRNSKFLYSSINNFSPTDTISFFESNGLKLKTERGNRVFPESDKASDVTKTFEFLLKKQGVKVLLNTEICSLIVDCGQVLGVKTKDLSYDFDSVIVCTGGISYPLTGSTGDGYKFASSVGHLVAETKPALVGIELKGEEFLPLQGISLKNVSFKALLNDKVIYSDFGEMIFTHYGVSGPMVLSCSSVINRVDNPKITFSIDLKPALSNDVLDARILREFAANKDKLIFNAVRSLLPKELVNLVIKRAGINANKTCSDISKKERDSLVFTLKNLTFEYKYLRPIEEAIVTSGGVSVNEINPKTMESKLVKGLFFAGEVIDVDCFTGGFNMQTAFSTGVKAGQNA